MFDRAFAFGRIITSSLRGDRKAVLANLELLAPTVPGAPKETSADEAMFGQLGIVAVPDDAEGDDAVEVIAIKGGDNAHPVAMRDLRLNAKVNPKKGEIDVVQYGGGFVGLGWNGDHDGTSITLYSPQVKNGTTKAHAIIMDTTGGNESICIVHMKGHAILLNDIGETVIKSPNGQNAVTVSDDAVTLSGVLGLLGGIVAGNPQLAEEVALAAATKTVFQALATHITAVCGAVTPTAVPEAGLPSKAALDLAIAALDLAGKSKVLKASPT